MREDYLCTHNPPVYFLRREESTVNDPRQNQWPVNPEDDEALYFDMLGVASSTETTGLTPTPPITGAAVQSYSELSDVPLAKDRMPELEGDEDRPRDPLNGEGER